ncbi:uncharacterized protein CLUP02_08835 [Colletotrichum lupini]|uniref:Uncharacterized protein n=1 Tax=Colletotrichum lupini TaxID=145971 RepID=A0A9Q8STU7_9PEZI|nr:uncharacterized protein CLUP02_08835 [Colletotrichum lupini]UQC83340.1 hypothetical protein CLUP02_08835 [Colletotrichum lupini]
MEMEMGAAAALHEPLIQGRSMLRQMGSPRIPVGNATLLCHHFTLIANIPAEIVSNGVELKETFGPEESSTARHPNFRNTITLGYPMNLANFQGGQSIECRCGSHYLFFANSEKLVAGGLPLRPFALRSSGLIHLPTYWWKWNR